MAISPQYLMFTDKELQAIAELEARIDQLLQETYARPVRFVEHCPAIKWDSWVGKYFAIDEEHPAWKDPNLQKEVVRRFTSAGWSCSIARKALGLKPAFMNNG
jgi:hypothetical protein